MPMKYNTHGLKRKWDSAATPSHGNVNYVLTIFFSNNLKLNLKLVMQIYEKYFVSGIYCRN